MRIFLFQYFSGTDGKTSIYQIPTIHTYLGNFPTLSCLDYLCMYYMDSEKLWMNFKKGRYWDKVKKGCQDLALCGHFDICC